MLKITKWSMYIIVVLFFLLLSAIGITHIATTPSNNRNWADDQKVLAYANIKNNLVTIHNIRDFTYTSTTSYTKHYYDKVFDVNKLRDVWYVVEPFAGIPGSAHTFLSFEFEGDQFVSISIEIRKEKGEEYSPLKGLFNQYELMYVIADENDVIKLRANYRHDPVYIYPIKGDKEKMKAVFLDMIKRANKLKESPEFYNTVTNNCTTNIAVHVDKIIPKRIPLFSWRILFPENSDRLAYDLGLIDTNLSFSDARKAFLVNDRAEKYSDDPKFSVRIREGDASALAK